MTLRSVYYAVSRFTDNMSGCAQSRMNDFSLEEQATRYKQTSEKLQHAKATVNDKRDEVASIERELAALNDEINRQVCSLADPQVDWAVSVAHSTVLVTSVFCINKDSSAWLIVRNMATFVP